MTTQSKNEVLLEGLPLHIPEFSHENHGTRFFRFPLEIPRLSGTPDVLPVILPASLCSQITPNCPLRLLGQFRSFNNRSGIGNKLVLTVYAQELFPCEGTFCNRITLSGALCKPPVFRHTPLGRSICDLMLAVPRKYGRADYLPVIAWGQLALQASGFQVGALMSLDGRIQSRSYQKVLPDGTSQPRVAYEVSMMHLLDEA